MYCICDPSLRNPHYVAEHIPEKQALREKQLARDKQDAHLIQSVYHNMLCEYLDLESLIPYMDDKLTSLDLKLDIRNRTGNHREKVDHFINNLVEEGRCVKGWYRTFINALRSSGQNIIADHLDDKPSSKHPMDDQIFKNLLSIFDPCLKGLNPLDIIHELKAEGCITSAEVDEIIREERYRGQEPAMSHLLLLLPMKSQSWFASFKTVMEQKCGHLKTWKIIKEAAQKWELEKETHGASGVRSHQLPRIHGTPSLELMDVSPDEEDLFHDAPHDLECKATEIETSASDQSLVESIHKLMRSIEIVLRKTLTDKNILRLLNNVPGDMFAYDEWLTKMKEGVPKDIKNMQIQRLRVYNKACIIQKMCSNASCLDFLQKGIPREEYQRLAKSKAMSNDKMCALNLIRRIHLNHGRNKDKIIVIQCCKEVAPYLCGLLKEDSKLISLNPTMNAAEAKTKLLVTPYKKMPPNSLRVSYCNSSDIQRLAVH
ncbi:hypothetical protein CAPTEDRAFT_219034 [Capitella teleta]|uniref:Caspase recruitment domain-containing protein n=1 Tax=Capitella teleta TaxID=283909 RepID=R7TDS9_CAPTE|nr:hypothetical protein CAPTEDRAFT_219034 [Capitella teleta]|eukprot:ELT91667.1 hypothetical protein CAPTEDRAFT_219034 [Capitella teleta]